MVPREALVLQAFRYNRCIVYENEIYLFKFWEEIVSYAVICAWH